MPRLAKNVGTRRLNLELTDEVRDRLEELRDEMGADSMTEVIRRSLALLDFAWKMKKQKGRELFFRRPNDETAQKVDVEFF